MKTRTGFVSNSSSTAYVVCNLDLLNIDDIDIANYIVNNRSECTIEDTKLRIENILKKLNSTGSFDTMVGYSEDSIAFSSIANHICKHKEKHLLYEVECGADSESYILYVTKDQIEKKLR